MRRLSPTSIEPSILIMPNNPLTYSIRNALKDIQAGGDPHGLVAAGRLTEASISPAGVAKVVLDTGRMPVAAADDLVENVKTIVAALEGVERVVIVPSHRRPQTTPPQGSASGHDNPLGLAQKPATTPAETPLLSGVKNVIAVASGKGGVGKSTVAANLASAFARRGRSVGFLDADIYGPSAPVLFGLTGAKPTVMDGKIQPIDAGPIKAMSIGFIVDEEKALAWRGPMVMGALKQLMKDVEWSPLDIMIIDTPPGTGDAHLTLAQSKVVTGAVIVSTPQTMALADVRRGVELFRKTGVNILGLVQNMAYLDIGDGVKRPLFGEDGARDAAQALSIPFLGDLPIMPDLRVASDDGAPLQTGAVSEAFDALAEQLSSSLK